MSHTGDGSFPVTTRVPPAGTGSCFSEECFGVVSTLPALYSTCLSGSATTSATLYQADNALYITTSASDDGSYVAVLEVQVEAVSTPTGAHVPGQYCASDAQLQTIPNVTTAIVMDWTPIPLPQAPNVRETHVFPAPLAHGLQYRVKLRARDAALNVYSTGSGCVAIDRTVTQVAFSPLQSSALQASAATGQLLFAGPTTADRQQGLSVVASYSVVDDVAPAQWYEACWGSNNLGSCDIVPPLSYNLLGGRSLEWNGSITLDLADSSHRQQWDGLKVRTYWTVIVRAHRLAVPCQCVAAVVVVVVVVEPPSCFPISSRIPVSVTGVRLGVRSERHWPIERRGAI